MTHSDDTGPMGPGTKLYDKLFLSGPMPYLTIILIAAATLFFGYYVRNFTMDASSESLMLEKDKDHEYYDKSRQIFTSDEYVFVVVTPNKDLFTSETLSGIKALGAELTSLPGVMSITSILNVPLVQSPPVPLFKLASGYKQLQNGDVDLELARKELTTSPLFSDYLVSRDGKSTIMQVTFKQGDRFLALQPLRYDLRNKVKSGTATPEEKQALIDADAEYKHLYRYEYQPQRDRNIDDVRAIIAKHSHLGTLSLGGMPMITTDMVRYIKRDIVIFGILVILFCAFMMWMIFKRVKLFLLPMLACIITLIIMMGYLGFVDWHTTVVTANFTSLLVIMTTENAIHLASHWRELLGTYPQKSKRELVQMTVVPVAIPCFFSTFTTMVGFSSLIVSGIRPVMDFGMMMTLGLGVGFAICFLFIPAMLMVLPKERPIRLEDLAESSDSHVSAFARLTERRPRLVMGLALLLFAVGGLGIKSLTVENRFMDYFRKSSPIRQGMYKVDAELGGTTPLEVIIDGDKPDYWLEPENLAKLHKIHQWIDELPETGKVISLDTMMQVLQSVNGGKPLNKGMINLVRTNLPANLVKDTLSPYVTPDYSGARITMRIKETGENLNRKELLQRINAHLTEEGYELNKNIHVTGVFVLYNNMLQSLFGSQIATVGTVFVTCFFIFWLIFRNFKLALMGLAPNVLAVTVILGTMGWLGIPLDMMTIMIAAITFGLADDNTIHYIHAFQKEFKKDRDYMATMYRCHNTIGRPLSYTMVTIVVGFAILVFSNFLPTVYFGIFTGLAMFLALMASHTLLPLMILYFKPLGPGSRSIDPAQAEEAA